jgi:hypothetical protein
MDTRYDIGLRSSELERNQQRMANHTRSSSANTFKTGRFVAHMEEESGGRRWGENHWIRNLDGLSKGRGSEGGSVNDGMAIKYDDGPRTNPACDTRPA